MTTTAAAPSLVCEELPARHACRRRGTPAAASRALSADVSRRGPFVDGERHLPRASAVAATVAVRRIDQRRRHRHDLVSEAAAVDRGERALVAAQRERVLLLARDARLARVVLGDQARCSDTRPDSGR